MNVTQMNGLAYESGTFNLQGRTSSQSGEAKLAEDIKFLLVQEKGKFYPDPEFGSELQKYMFEPMTDSLGKIMQYEIKTTIEKYYSQITLRDINISMNQDTNTVSVEIYYSYSDSDEESRRIQLELFNKIDQ